jgi:hypothetical protein
MDKIASATSYLQEEVSNARQYCDEIKQYTARAIELVNASTYKDHLYAIAGDVVYGMPDLVEKLEKSLNTAAMVLNTIDNDELQQILPQDEIKKLENALDNIRLKAPQKTVK